VIAPAMNNRMYEHAATVANLSTLSERGVRVVEPGVGRLASKGEHGVGRLAEPELMLAACERAIAERGAAGPAVDRSPAGPMRGLRVLVTAGGTREPIDSVRFIGNSSSGRMGFALAQAAQQRGAEVTLLAANVALPDPPGVERRDVGSAAELERACEEAFPGCDVLLMTAAVADFTPAEPANGKIKKAERGHLELTLKPTADVLSALAANRRAGQTLVGFAAEHGPEAVELAREKLSAKGLDALVVNDISREDIGFDVDANEVTILSAIGEAGHLERRDVARASKADVAEQILDAVESLRGRAQAGHRDAPAGRGGLEDRG
jgi:phosphopantothenoylcysteine decarboxylase/phosphopantothenate--cysteine ligase